MSVLSIIVVYLVVKQPIYFTTLLQRKQHFSLLSFSMLASTSPSTVHYSTVHLQFYKVFYLLSEGPLQIFKCFIYEVNFQAVAY